MTINTNAAPISLVDLDLPWVSDELSREVEADLADHAAETLHDEDVDEARMERVDAEEAALDRLIWRA